MPSIWAETLRGHRALVATRIQDAFAELLAERGLDGVTLSAVAERAGIARSAIYNYVADKHELLFQHAEDRISRFVDELASAAPEGADAGTQLATYVAHTVRAFADEPAGHDLMPSLTPEEQARLMRTLAPIHGVLRGIVDAGVRDGTFRAGTTDELVGFVNATLSGYRMPLARGEVDPEHAAATIIAVLLHGLTGEAKLF